MNPENKNNKKIIKNMNAKKSKTVSQLFNKAVKINQKLSEENYTPAERMIIVNFILETDNLLKIVRTIPKALDLLNNKKEKKNVKR